MTLPSHVRILIALAIGASGGTLFFLLSLPLPWMLGALIATMAASVLGAPVLAPARIRPATVAVIGVMLGARFTPETLGMAGDWAISLALLAVYMAVVAAVVVPFHHLAGKSDWQTSFLAGLPGGLAEMVEMGEEKGADVRTIILAHTLRIVMTIALIAIWFRLIEGHAVNGVPPATGTPLTVWDAGLLVGCAVIGAYGGARLKLPAASFLGPLILSAVVHAGGWSESAPPASVVIAAQVILGTILGCRFLGMRIRVIARAAALAAGSTLATLAIALAFALLIHGLIGISTEQVILALAPGGLTEMGLIALAIDADVAFVALHHVVRILIVLVMARPLFSLMPRR